MEFVASYKKVLPSFPSAYKLILYVYADSLEQARNICSKFYIEHYVLEYVYNSSNND